jgi:hypothetical protein
VIRLAQEGDWPSILEVHRAAFGTDDVPLLAAELHERADLYVPELPSLRKKTPPSWPTS